MMRAACMLALVLFAVATVPANATRAVTTADATVRADFAATLRPGKAVIVDNQCPRGGWFTETSAYRHDGSALAAQQWTRDHTLTYWRGTHGRVTFDGVMFHNGTRASVIVAGWCS